MSPIGIGGRPGIAAAGRRLGVVSRRTYAEAGVSLTAAEAVVERLRKAVESTGTQGFGAFAGLYPLDERRFLAASTDGVGTKLILLREAGRLRDGGRDLAAHCINDVLTTGAKPLFLLDYVAAGSIDLEAVAELIEGAAEVCRDAGCALIGGETAELPGIYRDGELDFAGTCIGIVDRETLIDGSRIEPGDLVVGFRSAGLHANGFTLARQILEEDPYDGPDLLAPTELYSRDLEDLAQRARAFHGLAHVTGGGILGNLSRVVPRGLRAEIDWESWQRPPVFHWLEKHVSEDEMRRVFNLGIGFCAVVPNDRSDFVEGDRVIGRIGQA
jgi:phosphoribosylformylglycinamidine cyclo-ligase